MSERTYRLNELVDAFEARTAKEVDYGVCYPIPPPDNQPIVVSWGLLRKLTDLAEAAGEYETELVYG